jgi:hypothetical protein
MSGSSLLVPSANKVPLSRMTAQPSMRDTITGWSETITLVRLLKKIVNHENVNERTEFTCQGMIQPFSKRDLLIKPEGQRAWKWWMLHISSSIETPPGAEFEIAGVTYKVMGELPYFRNGFYEYELVQGYE